jgi:hypothetical protein
MSACIILFFQIMEFVNKYAVHAIRKKWAIICALLSLHMQILLYIYVMFIYYVLNEIILILSTGIKKQGMNENFIEY